MSGETEREREGRRETETETDRQTETETKSTTVNSLTCTVDTEPSLNKLTPPSKSYARTTLHGGAKVDFSGQPSTLDELKGYAALPWGR